MFLKLMMTAPLYQKRRLATRQVPSRCDMSKPEVAEHVSPRFYMFSYPFLLLEEIGEANTLRDNKLL